MTQQQFSFYQSAFDNTGTVIAFEDIHRLIIGDAIKKDTNTYRTKFYIAKIKAEQDFEGYINKDIKSWNEWLQCLEEINKEAKRCLKQKVSNTTDAVYTAAIKKRDILFVDPFLKPAVALQEKKKTATIAADDFKKKFSAVVWSGLLKKRGKDPSLLVAHSGLICIDVDKLTLQQHDTFKKLLRNDAHIFFMFTSPSGVGLKLIFKIPINENEAIATQQTTAFLSISQYLKQEYNIVTDASGKDVCRLCFLCFDAHAFYNPGSNVFPVQSYTAANDNTKQPVQTTLTKQQEKKLTQTELTANDVFEFTQNISSYTPHSGGGGYNEGHNNFVYLFACNCNRRGISQIECESFALSLAASDLGDKTVKATVNSAYTHNTNEHGKFAKRANAQSTKDAATTTAKKQRDNKNDTGNTAQPGKRFEAANITDTDKPGQQRTDRQLPQDAGDEETPHFWHTSVNEKTGKETIHLQYTNFYDFLETQGFANLKIDSQNVELIHVDDNIVSPVIINNTRNDLKKYMNEYCKDNDLYNVLEMLHRGQDKYFARKQFVNLGYRAIDFLRDTEDVSFHFHSNCVVECRADGITVRDYKLGEKALWATQVNPRPFKREQILINTMLASGKPVANMLDLAKTIYDNEEIRVKAETTDCEFAKYQMLASCHPDSDVSPNTANKRFLAHATSYGYLINNFKPSIGKAIVGVDHHKAIDKSEQNGRTGKGILSKAIGHVTKRFPVDGRRYDPKDQSVFEGLTMDAKVITVDDCNERFDFGNFFVPVTEDFTVRKMYLGYITLPYEISPKWYFNTNFTFRGDGDSFTGRQHIIEFDNFFNKKYTPIHYFNHSLFRDWDDNEWNRFYNYAYECDCLYKALGLVDYEGGNYSDRKLSNECPEEFIDFIDATDEHTGDFLRVKRNQWFEKKTFLKEWSKECLELNMPAPKSKALYGMMKKYCQTKGTGFYTKKANSEELYWIGHKMPVPMVKTIKEIVQIPADKKENNPVILLDV